MLKEIIVKLFLCKSKQSKIYIPNNYINGADVGDEVDVLISYSEQASIAHVQKVLEKHKKSISLVSMMILVN